MLQHSLVAAEVAFLCLALTPLGAAAQAQGPTPSWRAAAEAALERREYAFQALADGVWSAPNRAHGLRSRVSAAGIELARRAADGAPEWRVALRTAAFGRAGACEPLGVPVLAARDERVELDHGRLEEWFENRPEGLEQGWTIAARPPGVGALWIELELDGDLQLCLDEGGRAGEWLDAAGRARLRYAHLHAFDANERELDARMERTRDGLRIEVDDEGACYPLTVDPLFEDPDWSVEGNQASSYFGDCVAGAGDVDGDGFDDVLVGATFFDNGQVDEGRVYLFRGSAVGLATSPAWVVESNVPGPGGTYTEFGHFVAGAGDVNGDGFDDVLVGARRWNDGEHAEGRVFLYLGSASGLAGSAAWSTTSNVVDGHLGSVAGAGDVNGDGYDDVLLGAFGYDGGLHGEGAAFLYLGSSTGLGSAWDWQALGGQTDGFFGFSVASAGDVNGDGLDDVIVGATGFSSPESSEGGAFVYLGTPTGLGALPAWSAGGDQNGAIFGEDVAGVGDVDGDGFDDVLIGARYFDVGGSNEGRVFLYRGSASGLGLSPAWTKDGTQFSNEFGHSVAGAGDVNGDGFDDALVGSYRYSNPLASEGAAFLFLGSTTGLGARAAWRGEGQLTGAAFGHSVAGAGDVNADGHDDWIVGALFHSNGQINEGAAFAYLGS